MREQRTPAPSEEDDTTDRTVMLILLDRDHPWPRSVDELGRELGEDPADSVARLRGAGLLSKIDRFVWPTRAAVRAEQLCL
jgi:hypothetical protein